MFFDQIQYLQNSASKMELLSKAECVEKYSKPLLTGRRNVLAITSSTKASKSAWHLSVQNSSVLLANAIKPILIENHNAGNVIMTPYAWICSGLDYDRGGDKSQCVPQNVALAEWTVFGYPIDYCLSEVVNQHCRLQVHQMVGIIVVVCNGLKVCCMLYAARKLNHNRLCTTG